MRIKKNLFILIISLSSLSVAMNSESINSQGSIGIGHSPSAYFMEEGSLGYNYNFSESFRRTNLIAQPYKWAEFSIFYADLPYVDYTASLGQSYKDKGFNAKFLLKEESNYYPQLAIGFSDFVGTGIFSGEYLVASKTISNLELTLGVGWGIYSNGLKSKNPFIYLSDSFKERSERYIDEAGEVESDNYFSGEKASIFTSVTYSLNDHKFYIQQNPLDLSSSRFNNPKKNSKYIVGYKFYGLDYFKPSISLEDNGNLNFSFEASLNFSKISNNNFKEPEIKRNVKLLDFIEALQKNELSLKEIYTDEDGIVNVGIRQNNYRNLDKSISNTASSLKYSNIEGVDEIIVKNYSFGKEVARDYINLKDFDQKPIQKSKKQLRNSIFKNEENFPRTTTNFYPSLKTLIASRESFLSYGINLNLANTVFFSEASYLETTITTSLSNNFDELSLPPINTYPNQVRSDIKDYYKVPGNKPFIQKMEYNYFTSINDDYFSVKAGLFESMFGGIGFEYLHFNRFTNFAYGAEIFKVRKRDYDQRFNFLDYEAVTGHLNFYYYLPYFDLTSHLSFGKYLAGDKGGTLDFSRRFKNGFKVGAFFSITNVTKEQFGEGSFDKGIYFSIPIKSFANNSSTSFRWRPLTKDPAQKLGLDTRLFNVIDRYMY